MADANRKVQIDIKTTADTSGAKETASALNQVTAAEEELSAASWAAAGAANNIADEMRDEERAANELENSQRKLINAQNEANRKNAESDAQNTKSAGGFKNIGQAVGQAGFQIQDAAVQIQGGTSAVTALSQQGSQLAGVFGPTGAVVGAFIALGAIVYKVITAETTESLKKATDQAKAMGDQLMETAKAAGSREFAEFADNLEHIFNLQSDINQATSDAKQSDRDKATAIRDIANAYRESLQAANEFLAATDPKFNKQAADKAASDQDRASDKDSAIQLQRDKQDAARDQYSLVLKERELVEQQRAEVIAQQNALQQQANDVNSQLQKLLEINPKKETFAAQIQGLEAQLDKFATGADEAQKKIDSFDSKINANTQKAFQIAASLDAVITGTETEIQKIEGIYNAEQAAADSKAATDRIKSSVENLGKFLEDFQAVTPVQQQAEDDIAAAIKDGKITAEESKRISQDLKLLMSGLSANQQGNRENLDDLIKNQDSLTNIIIDQKRAIEGLTNKINGIVR